MHDVCLQAEYIAAGDAAAGMSPDDLGLLFLEYEHVECYRVSTTAVGLSSDLADLIRSSPARPFGEVRNQAEYDRVKANYLVKPGNPQVRRQWYPGTTPMLFMLRSAYYGRNCRHSRLYVHLRQSIGRHGPHDSRCATPSAPVKTLAGQRLRVSAWCR